MKSNSTLINIYFISNLGPFQSRLQIFFPEKNFFCQNHGTNNVLMGISEVPISTASEDSNRSWKNETNLFHNLEVRLRTLDKFLRPEVPML